MYSIFRPLDPNERLPREVVVELARRRMWQMRDVDLGAALFLPVLTVTFIAFASFRLPALLAFALAFLAVTGSYAAVAVVRRSSSLHP